MGICESENNKNNLEIHPINGDNPIDIHIK